MKTYKQKITKPASKDPVKEALHHPNGASLPEMLAGQEDKKSNKKPYNVADSGDIPII